MKPRILGLQQGAVHMTDGIKPKSVLTTCKHNSANWVITTERVICVQCESSMRRALKACINVAKILWIALFLLHGCTKRITNVYPQNNNDLYSVTVNLTSDSTVDVVPELQAAISSLPVSGGQVIIQDGVHLIGSNFSYSKSNVWLKGTGTGCILKIKEGSNLNAINIANHTWHSKFSDFVISGMKETQTNIWGGVGINANGSDIRYITAENVWIRHTTGAGIVMANGASDGKIYFCRIDSTGVLGNTNVNVGFGIYIVTNCSRVDMQYNTFVGTSATACIRVNNNCSNITAKNNLYHHNDLTGISDRRAVFIDGGVNGRCHRIEVSNETIFGIDENGLFLNDIDTLKVNDNDIHDIGYNGIELNTSTEVELRNNSMVKCDGAGMSFNQVKRGILDGNYNIGCGKRGIHIYAAGSDSTTDLTLNNNHCFDNSVSVPDTWSGIEIGVTYPAFARRINLTNNECVSKNGVMTQKYGVQITNDVDYYIIKNNLLNPNLRGGLFDGGGAHKTIEGNL